jgi:hypothetical protein
MLAKGLLLVAGGSMRINFVVSFQDAGLSCLVALRELPGSLFYIDVQ